MIQRNRELFHVHVIRRINIDIVIVKMVSLLAQKQICENKICYSH